MKDISNHRAVTTKMMRLYKPIFMALLVGVMLALSGATRAQEDVQGEIPYEADICLAPLELALAVDDAKVRLRAVAKLADDCSRQASEVLATTALYDADPSVREEAASRLAKVGGESCLTILEKMLLDPDLQVRETAVEEILSIGGDNSARALAIVLTDQAVSLREEVVFALGEIGGEVATGILLQALADEHRSVREAAAEILAELQGSGFERER